MRIVHYVNQFFAGRGGEDAASSPPERHDGTVGPGRLLAKLLDDHHEIVATVSCGDDYAASEEGAAAEILELAREAGAELVVAGPAFTSGRNGLACGRVAAAAVAAGLPAVAAMHPDNVGVDEAGAAPVIASGEAAHTMKPSMEQLAAAVNALAAGQTLGTSHGRIGRVPRRNTEADQPAARRAVDLALARLAGDSEATEIPLAAFEGVNPAGAVEDLASATVALVTESGLVPIGNPDGLEAARATRWIAIEIDGTDSLAEGSFESVDGGFSTVIADADPNRLVPLDAARALAGEGVFGDLHPEILATTGNGMPVASARRFGVEWASKLRKAGVQAAILTAT